MELLFIIGRIKKEKKMNNEYFTQILIIGNLLAGCVGAGNQKEIR
ncbi:hypothetical protein J6TS1_45650 [Siminovitchia terrae]|uniref:Lipoprotein n=1 Tax=Siminovitchia terrae TaxID=1914933 RepID=A0ABQ4L348_SIMTE|nr:hypothetical protein J6TS1_45650 [Siminovitchia terrae]